jgi:hypothetical protein
VLSLRCLVGKVGMDFTVCFTQSFISTVVVYNVITQPFISTVVVYDVIHGDVAGSFHAI